MAYAGKSGQPRTRVAVESRTNRGGVLVAGVAIGLVVGVGIALLVGPAAAGRRRRIGRTLRGLMDRGQDAWGDLGHELRRARRQLRRARAMAKVAATAASATATATRALPD